MLNCIYIFLGDDMENKSKKVLLTIAVILFMVLLLLMPVTGRRGAADGIVLCGSVVIPSLFPFTFCVLLLMRSEFEKNISALDRITFTLFNLNSKQFAVFIFSLIGGYPVGARLIEELYSNGQINLKNARILQCCCVNSGPAFTVLFAGQSILGSKSLGFCIFAASSISSFLLLIFSKNSLDKFTPINKKERLNNSFSEIFVSSASDSSASMISICTFVILFSTINSYILSFPQLRNLAYFTEITGGITQTHNIYFITFLLGFGGISVWLQVISISRNIGINMIRFILFRVLHGGISALLTAVIIKIFKFPITTLSNNVSFISKSFYSSAAVGTALFIMVLIFFISLFGKNHSRNLLKDMI